MLVDKKVSPKTWKWALPFTKNLRGGMRLAYYQARLTFSWGHILFFLLSGILEYIQILENTDLAYQSFYKIFEIFFPLIASFLFVNQILKEQEQHTLTIIGTTGVSLQVLFIVRVILLGGYLTTMLLVYSILLQQLATGPVALGATSVANAFANVFFTLGAPTLFLAGIGTLAGHISADSRVGYMLQFALWMYNRAAGLTINAHPFWRMFFLFPRSRESGDWIGPKVFQLILGLIFLTVSWNLAKNPEQFLKK